MSKSLMATYQNGVFISNPKARYKKK